MQIIKQTILYLQFIYLLKLIHLNTPYLLIPVGIISIFLYLLSLLLVRLGMIQQLLHRKIWNVILLIVFLTTAILGILLAIQINYKFEWDFVKAAIKWHVDFGIGMSFVAVFHVIWHLRYYLNLFKSSNGDAKSTKPDQTVLGSRILKYLILLSGFIATVVQVLLIRQIATVFEGNELMMGWTLGAWMLLTGTGAFVGRQSKKNLNEKGLFAFILFILGVLPIVAIIVITLVKNQIFPVGVMVSPTYFLITLFIVLSPICLLLGYAFSLLIRLFNFNQDDFIKVYAFESIGSLVGGIVVSFVFIQWLTILQSLFVLLLLISISLFVAFRNKVYIVASVLVLIFTVLIFLLPVENGIKSFLFTNQKVLESKETYYGNLTITENSDQYNFYSNGSLLFTTDNTILNEENVHYAMLQRQNSENVLIISGGISGMIGEILKYPSVKSVDYLELNQQLVKLASKYKPLPVDQRLRYIERDGRRFIQTVNKTYDVVIFAIPEPSSFQINRFYTDEFLKKLKRKLAPDAVVTFGLPPAGNYISPVKAKIEASVFQTLKKNFRNVEIIPGEKDYLLASDSPINIKISEIVGASGIKNSFVNPYYIDDFSIQQRGELIKKNIEGIEQINSDSRPFPVFYETLRFISQFGGSNWIYVIIPILLLLPMFFFPSVSKGMYFTGFSGASIELLLIFSFQIVYGYVYSALGLIIAVFMGGLAIGSMLGYRFKIAKRHFVFSQLFLGLYALVFPLIWYLQNEISSSIVVFAIFLVMTLIPSIIVGFQFVVGAKLLSNDITKSVPAIYAADLIGSALGVVAITVFLLPLLGLVNSCLVIAGLNFLAIGLINIK